MTESDNPAKFPLWAWQFLNKPFSATANERGDDLQKRLIVHLRKMYPDEASQYYLDTWDEDSWYHPLNMASLAAFNRRDDEEFKRLGRIIDDEIARRYPSFYKERYSKQTPQPPQSDNI